MKIDGTGLWILSMVGSGIIMGLTVLLMFGEVIRQFPKVDGGMVGLTFLAGIVLTLLFSKGCELLSRR